MFSKRVARNLAELGHERAVYYGKYDGILLHGSCFYHVDKKNKVVDVGISSGDTLYFFSFPINPNWIYKLTPR